MIYLDHNATTPMDSRVFEAMEPYFCQIWGNPSSGHRVGFEARKALQEARHSMAFRLGCMPQELVFCSGGTEADNLALRGVAGALSGKGRHIVTSNIEHHAVLQTCRSLEKEGFEVTQVGVSPSGVVDVQALEAALRKDTILVSVIYANHETGVIQPIEKIGELVRRRGIVMHTDGVQAVGKIPIHLGSLPVDLLSMTAHKLHGPKGVGALFVRQNTPLCPLLTGGSQEMLLRAGTENVAGAVGFAEALGLVDVAKEMEHLEALRDRLENRVLGALEGVRINGRGERRIPNTSNMSVEAVDGESMVLGMDMLGVCASTGSACATGEEAPSHILSAMGLSAQEAQTTIRLSLGRQQTAEEIDEAADILVRTVERLRGISTVTRQG